MPPGLRTLGLRPRRPFGFKPTALPGLVLWLDANTLGLADGATVAPWPDQSGNGRDLAHVVGGNDPVFHAAQVNGKPVVRFDGSMQILRSASFAVAQPFTVCAVVKQVTTGYLGVNDGLCDGLTASRAACLVGKTTTYFEHRTTLYAGAELDAPWTPRGYSLLTFTFNGTSSLVRRNGVTLITGPGGAQALDGLTLGAAGDGSRRANVDVAELVIVANLSDADRGRLETYLAARYGLGLPTGTLVQFVFDGDSQMAGFTAAVTADCPNLATANAPGKVAEAVGPNVLPRCFAKAGDLALVRGSLAAGLINPLYDGTLAGNITFLIAGTNDVGGSPPGPVLLMRVQKWHDTVHAAGFRSVATTIMRATAGGSTWDDCNTRLRAATDIYDELCDLQSNATIADHSNTTYWDSGGGHPTDAGYTVIANLFTAAANTLLTAPPPALSPPASGTVICSDGFSGTVGTDNKWRSLDTTGLAWDTAIDSGCGQLDGTGGVVSTGAVSAVTNARYPDMTVQVTVVRPVGQYVGLLFRYAGGTDYFGWYLSSDGVQYVQRTLGGTVTSPATPTWSDPGGAHVMKVVCSGTTLTGFLDGVQQWSIPDSSYLRLAVGAGYKVLAGSGCRVSAFSAKVT